MCLRTKTLLSLNAVTCHVRFVVFVLFFSHGKFFLLDHQSSSMCDSDGDDLCVVCLSLSL